MLVASFRRVLVAASIGVYVAGCGEPATSATRLAPRGPQLSLIGGQAVLNVQLRTAPSFPEMMSGKLQLKINFSPGDPCIPGNPIIPGNPVIPGNPIVPPPGMTNVAICATIHNPGGAALIGGGIYTSSLEIDVPPSLVTPFLAQVPQPPPICPDYKLTGYVQVTDELASQFINAPERFQILFDGKAPDGPSTRIGGSLSGGAWGAVGTPQPPPIEPSESDACNIAIPTPPPI